MHMSRLGKSFKNRFLRQALAMVLAGTMVMTSMPVSLAAEQSDAKASVEAEVQGRTEAASEEAAEDGELSEKESSEAKTGESENGKITEETEAISAKTSESAEESKEEVSKASETKSAVVETEASETETDTEETTETEQTTEEEENEATTGDAKLADGHENAKWYFDETIVSSNNKTNEINGATGTYTNKLGDVLYIDATKGKFTPDKERKYRIQVNVGTIIHIPVITDDEGKAKIKIYQSSISKKEDITNSLEFLKGEEVLSSEIDCTSFI